MSGSQSADQRGPDLVRIEIVRHERDEDFEGAVGLLVDTDIDWNGHGVYTVHLPTQNVDVQCREITTIAKAQQGEPNGVTQ